jgi:hypothetical protein
LKFRPILLAALALLAPRVLAQDGPSEQQRLEARAAGLRAQADRVLDESAKTLAEKNVSCHQQFLVARCLEQARERDLAARREVRRLETEAAELELEARRLQRAADAAERERRAAQQAADRERARAAGEAAAQESLERDAARVRRQAEGKARAAQEGEARRQAEAEQAQRRARRVAEAQRRAQAAREQRERLDQRAAEKAAKRAEREAARAQREE